MNSSRPLLHTPGMGADVYGRHITNVATKPGHWVRVQGPPDGSSAKWQFETFEERDNKHFRPVARAHLRLAWARAALALRPEDSGDEWNCCDDLIMAVAEKVEEPKIAHVVAVKVELEDQLLQQLQPRKAQERGELQNATHELRMCSKCASRNANAFQNAPNEL